MRHLQDPAAIVPGVVGYPPVPRELASFDDFLEFLFSRRAQGVKLGLEQMHRMLERLGHPEAGLRALHVAGTNGKGSTSAMLAAVLRAAGFRTALYTSPHLVDFTERIRVDGASVSEEEVLLACRRLLPHLEEVPLTFFEIATVVAFLLFAERGVDLAVVEVGLGGRLDATNVLLDPVPVITDVHFDHERILGNRLREITAEKAGIIRGPRRVVTGIRRRALLEVVREQCRQSGAPLSVLDDEARWAIRDLGWGGTRFVLRTRERDYGEIFLPLPGEHQVRNAALAVRAVEVLDREMGLGIAPEAVRAGLAGVVWPGRLQVVGRSPLTVLDAAHNPNGAKALGRALRSLAGGRRVVLVIGMLADKRHAAVLRCLAPLGHELVLTAADTDRAASVEDLARVARKLGYRCERVGEVGAAIAAARRLAGEAGIVCVTGSCYMVGDALRALGVADAFARGQEPGNQGSCRG